MIMEPKMRKLNANEISDGKVTVEFYGWTRFDNEKYPDVYDEIEKYRRFAKPKGDEIIGEAYYDPPEKKEYCEALMRCGDLFDALVAHRCFVKNIKFSGAYHQNGEYGAPLMKTDYGVFRWTCSFRYWGEVMERAKAGTNYMEWAWDAPEEEITPDKAVSENLVS